MFIKRSHIAATHDILMAAISFAVALYLRLGNDFLKTTDFLLPGIFLFTSVCAVVFSVMGLYKGIWRYASMDDLLALTKSVTLAVLIFLPLMFFITRLEEFPRSVIIINWLVLLVMLGAPRFIYRAIKDKGVFTGFAEKQNTNRVPVLLAGISDTSTHFLRECANKKTSEYQIVGIVDSNPSTHGSRIHNVKVYGGFDVIPKVVDKLRQEGNAPKQIIVGLDKTNGTIVRNILKDADALKLSLAKLPRITDLNHNIQNLSLKPIVIEDLLGRPPTTPNLGRRHQLIAGKHILVTGAGGTIGSELVRQIALYKPASITLVELSEFNLYSIDQEISIQFPDIPIRSFISNVMRVESLDPAFNIVKPDIVFHAAALKHVPIVEDNIIEAVLTNVIGTKNVADMCLKHNVSKMILISTDKAVNPSSLMGVTKRLAECYIQAISHTNKESKTDYVTVRFGNVLGSSGSVIPLFQKQLEKGGPITITDPRMTRYFMTVTEAVELVLQTSTLNAPNKHKHHAIFVLDMGEPVRIYDLACQMIKLAGLEVDVDIKIETVGIRPGEKLYEELFYNTESSVNTLYDGILQAKAHKINAISILEDIETLHEFCLTNKIDEVVKLLSKLVPEYERNNESKHAA